MTSVSTPEEISNLALDAISWPRSIGNIYDGTKEARVALRLYGQTRDDLLRMKDWPFARQAVALMLLRTATVGGYVTQVWNAATNPPPPWIYEYAYPTGCILLRAVRPVPFVIPEFDPKPHIFVLGNDTVTNEQVILTNLANAQAVYTGQVTDMTQWEPGFVQALVAALALQFQKALVPEANAVKERAGEEQSDVVMADARRG